MISVKIINHILNIIEIKTWRKINNMIIQKTIKINTNTKTELINITPQIQNTIKNTIQNGIINIYTKHTTTSIIINEDEKNLKKDILNTLKEIIPNKKYQHDTIDNNAKSHLESLILPTTETIPIQNGKLQLGTWQSIFLIEHDGPRNNRTINITIIGE